MEETTPDGLTQEQLDNAYEVLEVLRENFNQEGVSSLAETVNEAHYLIQQYEETADWTLYELPEVGDVVTDLDAPNGAERVEVVDVYPNSRSDNFRITVDGVRRRVSSFNPRHPDEAPVVQAEYVRGGDMTYSFPVTRLDW